MLNNHGNRSYGMSNGILFQKLFWTTERKKNKVIEKVFYKFEA